MNATDNTQDETATLKRFFVYEYPTNADLGEVWAANRREAKRIVAREMEFWRASYEIKSFYLRDAPATDPPAGAGYADKVLRLRLSTGL